MVDVEDMSESSLISHLKRKFGTDIPEKEVDFGEILIVDKWETVKTCTSVLNVLFKELESEGFVKIKGGGLVDGGYNYLYFAPTPSAASYVCLRRFKKNDNWTNKRTKRIIVTDC